MLDFLFFYRPVLLRFRPPFLTTVPLSLLLLFVVLFLPSLSPARRRVSSRVAVAHHSP